MFTPNRSLIEAVNSGPEAFSWQLIFRAHIFLSHFHNARFSPRKFLLTNPDGGILKWLDYRILV